MNTTEFEKIIQPLLGQKAWGVTRGHGSFITMEFGELEKEYHTRRGQLIRQGQWHLWIYHCGWRLEKDDYVLASDGDEDDRIDRAIAQLEGKILENISFSPPVWDTVFQFEQGYQLKTFCHYSNEYEQWKLRTPNGMWLTIGPAALWSYVAGDHAGPLIDKETWRSANFNSREGQAVDMVIIHYTGMQSAEAALERLCDPASEVSAHYVIDEDGTIYGLVDEADRAWHAGVSEWQGATNINSRSIGIELVNPGYEHGYREFPPVQIDALIALLKDILARHRIPLPRVLGHSDVAPGRKQDPGHLFPWDRLAAAGVAMHRHPVPVK